MLRQERYLKYMYLQIVLDVYGWGVYVWLYFQISRFGKLIIESKYYLVLSLRGRT